MRAIQKLVPAGLGENRQNKLFQSGKKNIMDESPLAYKDIDTIIKSLKETGLAEPAARFKPIAVIKG